MARILTPPYVSRNTATPFGTPRFSPDGVIQRPIDYGWGGIMPPLNTTAWAAATVSTTGAPTITNAADWAQRMLLISTGAQAALIRQYAGLSGSANWLPGLGNQINWDVPWRVRWSQNCLIGGNGTGFKWTMMIGGLNAAPTGHTLSNKGVAVCIAGTGANAGTIQILAHNGIIGGASSAVAQSGVFNGTLAHWELQYVPGTGLYLLKDGELVTTLATNLPSGIGGGSFNGWAMLMEHTIATAGISIVNTNSLQVRF